MRRAALVVSAAFALALLGVGWALCQQPVSHGPTNPGRWVATPVATCEYDINAQQAPRPHEAMSQLVGEHQTVCPFVSGQPAPVLALVTSFSEACSLSGAPDLKVVKRTQVTLRQFVTDEQRCDPLLGATPTPPGASTSAGPVFVITAHEPDAQSSLQHFSEVHDALARSGLPINYAISWGENGTQFFCFEMMSGEDLDPLTYLKAHSPWLSSEGKEHRSSAANCGKATRELGVEAPTRGQPEETIPSQYVLSIKRSTASPQDEDYRSAVVNAFGQNGAAPVRESSDPKEQTMLADKDTYAKFDLGVSDLPDTNAVAEFTQMGLRLRITKVSPDLCAGLFAALVATDSYVAKADYEAPDIAPQGVRGDPPARAVIRSLTWVGDAKDLCHAIQPSFDRWRSAAATGATQ